ncbi:MAG: hypothetical protein ABJP45_15960 [Cyclobacteriaceae bacterium]
MVKSLQLKEALVAACIQIIEKKLVTIDQELALVQKSANEETKSSAGDKYETGRAMLMLEKEKFLGQKDQLFNQLKPLKSIDVKKQSNKVEFGAIVFTTGSNYFIATGLGKITVNSTDFLVVSAMAPIAQSMLGKQEGEDFTFNGNSFNVTKIF